MTIPEKAIRFRQRTIIRSGSKVKQFVQSMSQHVLKRNISSKSMHTFFSNLANRQTNEHGQKRVPPPLSQVNKFYCPNKWKQRQDLMATNSANTYKEHIQYTQPEISRVSVHSIAPYHITNKSQQHSMRTYTTSQILIYTCIINHIICVQGHYEHTAMD